MVVHLRLYDQIYAIYSCCVQCILCLSCSDFDRHLQTASMTIHSAQIVKDNLFQHYANYLAKPHVQHSFREPADAH